MVVGGMVTASDVSFTTDTICSIGTSYTAAYNLTYSDNISASTCAESGTTFQWYRADDVAGTNKAAISGATSSSYTVSAADEGYYLSVGVTPNTVCGTVGIEAFSSWLLVNIFTAPDGTAVVEITSASGRVWMDRNLGATQAATSSTDYLAYGSLFQWCRAADGHQLITWTSSTSGTPVNGTTSTLATDATNVGHSLFIISTSSPYDWLSTQQSNGSLWWNGSIVGANNPCPFGYHVPTKTEWATEDGAGITNTSTAYSLLLLPAAGYRLYSTGALISTGTHCTCWSATTSSIQAYGVYISSTLINSSSGNNRGIGFSLRCIQDE